MKCKAVVRTVLQWGAFVALPDYGDVEGVIHMSEASHNRSARLDELFRPGREIEVEVLRVDDKGKLWLSHKATIADPWDEAAKKYASGTRLTGKVVRLTDFGAFVQLEPGIDGLCHVGDLSFTPIDHPKEVVSEGTDLDVVVAYLDTKARKVTLHPAPPDDEKDLPTIRKVQLYKVVEVVVMQIRDGGLGVRILGATGRNARAFIPSGQTGTPRGTDLRKSFPLGKRLQAKVIDADMRRGEPRLSIRAVKQDAEKQAYRDYRKKVQRESSFGTFADLLKNKI
jgi:small subunit ribosomal protein S1